ncbi:MAG: transcription termination factor Rho, partial [Actinomycetota bacterium]|nr:transcription termination factor Rho [Actinomycetota bacterium]
LKPASRTSKANLVGQILRATGVDVGTNGERGTPKSPAPAEKAGPELSGNGSGGGNGSAVEAAEAERVAPETPSTPPAPATDAGGEPPVTAQGGDRTPGTGTGTGTETPTSQPEADQADQHQARQADQQPGDQQPGDQRPGDQQPGDQQRADRGPRDQRQLDGAGQLEPGNRRRRRRGRDRDRGGTERAERDPRGERDLQGGVQDQQFQGEPVPVAGLLDLTDQGYGFLRAKGYLSSPNDVYVSISQVRRFGLRKGDQVEGTSRPASSSEKYPALLRIDSISGLTPDEARERPRFEDLTPLFPDSKLRLEIPGDSANMVARIVDLISPIGKGQRGLIVSPPKAGKTTVLKQIAHSIEANNPEVHLMVLLVDERPEEVTDMRRSVKGEVVSSTFDRPSDEHTAVAELAIDRAKRLVEMGRDVVIVLDGITRLARAYNLAAPASGRILSGGVDANALYPPKRFFGSARNIEEGGSLTILATALVETGSRMDEVIFEEFKGTGNMELRLDRKLAERRLYPAIDVNASSTRHEELLFERIQLQQVWKLRRVLNALGSEGSAAAGLELLMEKIKTTKSNDEFLAEIAKGPTPPV